MVKQELNEVRRQAVFDAQDQDPERNILSLVQEKLSDPLNDEMNKAVNLFLPTYEPFTSSQKLLVARGLIHDAIISDNLGEDWELKNSLTGFVCIRGK